MFINLVDLSDDLPIGVYFLLGTSACLQIIGSVSIDVLDDRLNRKVDSRLEGDY